MKIVDLIELVQTTGDINQKIQHVVTALATSQTATLNAVLAILTVLQKTPGIDIQALKDELLDIKGAPIASKDINPVMYAQVLDLFISRLD